MKKGAAGLWLVGSLLICGCATAATRVTSAAYGTSAYLPTDPGSVRIFREFPPGEFIKIGEVTIVAPVYQREPPLLDLRFGVPVENDVTFEAKLKEEAAKMGGHAVVIQEDAPLGVRGGDKTKDTYWNAKEEEHRASGSTHTTEQTTRPWEYGRRFFGIVIRLKNDG